MSSLLQRKFPSILHSSTLPIPHSYRKPLLLATSAAAISAPLLTYAYNSYTEWLALGRGGVPYHVFGWLAQTTLHLLARTDLREPIPRTYKTAIELGSVYGPAGTKSYLSTPKAEIPARKPPRPTVPSFVAPQRQTSDRGPPHTVATLNGFLAALASANPGLFEVRESKLEGPLHQAVWLRYPLSSPSPSPTTAAETQAQKAQREELKTRLGRGATGEIAHVHREGSTHVILSPVDAAQVIGKGWGERHAMSGVGGVRWAMAPWGYVLVYAPRDEGELEVWREVVLAGARYVTAGLGKGVVVPGGKEGV
ncbi:uncharacterized protein GGS22DRAFT_172304 [Annulohypoxylon maeteangense]|uniref:uncharacterized protein n=1 Tax=Annulohypoxylon maeteangense TaxID=1927788 RepID=UPI0020085744|nr:uncharacterized protein GGS22DRAFT_172304 [Annulohypoxylon maeteangense]KAI0881497.1 hypothetical protein GGS22DRAFT_172304 [Annulohypoxylon maeteangense]